MPAGNAVATAPGAGQTQLNLARGRIHLHVTFKRTNFKAGSRRAEFDQMRQELVAPGPVVAVKLAVGRDDNQLWLADLAFARLQLIGQIMAREEVRVTGCIPVERDTAGERSVVEKDRYAASIEQAHAIRFRRINWSRRLPGGEHCVCDAMLSQNIQRL